MKDKKVINRYVLVEYVKEEKRNIKSNKDIITLFEYIDEYNKKDNPYFLSNVKVNKLIGIISFQKYRKITSPSTLEKIDLMTTMYDSDYSMGKFFDSNKAKPQFSIAYKANKKVNILPIIYKSDKRFTDRKYVKDNFIINANDYKFISEIINCNKVSMRDISESDLYSLREILKSNTSSTNITPIMHFYNSFISKGGRFNYFNFRILGLILKSYEEKIQKEIMPDYLVETPTHQLMFKDIDVGSKKSLYESMKLGLVKNNRNDL